jgi:undecaprenyl-diphosphatase
VAGQGDISLPVILAITWACAFAGDSVSFMLGARLGRGFLVKHGRRFRISEERLKQVEGYFARYGGRTILIGRFIGLVRALAPFIAGSGGASCLTGTSLRTASWAPASGRPP